MAANGREKPLSIGCIVWPENPTEAINAYLRFILAVFAEQNITLPDQPNDATALTRRRLAGQVDDAVLDGARDSWWAVVDDADGIRDFKSMRMLDARFALCLLSVRDKDAPILGEHISWFFELMGYAKYDTRGATALMKRTFTFSRPV